jgi:hypothetical protein
MQWPPTEESLRVALPTQENSLFEYKQEWYDLSSKRGKAEFVKDVLAMGNTTEPDRPGFIVIGIEDAKHGGRTLGVDKTPDPEQILQLLSSYASPVPGLECVHLQYSGVTVSVLRIGWNSSLPYYAIRDCEGVLNSNLVYIRRGATVGVLRPAELEALIRNKEARMRAPYSDRILDVGFVENGLWGSKVVARFANLTEEPISDLTVMWDVRLPAWPGAFTRWRSFGRSQLGPAETREDEFDPTDHYYQSPYENFNVHSSNLPGIRWFDITLHVQYRDHDGFLQQLERHLSIGN